MTEKQYVFAYSIAEALNLSLPRDYSTQAFSNFISDNLSNFQEWQKEENEKQKLRLKIQKDNFKADYESAKLEDIMNSKFLYEQDYIV